MKDSRIRILSTRPLSDALIEKAALDNIRVETATFIEVRKLVTPEVESKILGLALLPATVVFTSMNAVEKVVETIKPAADAFPDWKIYCLGGSSFTLVKKYWPYNNIVATAKNAGDLARRIVSDKAGEVHFFCGNIRREELPELLRNENVLVNEYVVYETIHTPVKVEDNYDAVLFFSPSAADSFFSLNNVPAETVLFAIGATTAATLKKHCTNNVVIGEFPAKEQLVEKAVEYFKGEREKIKNTK